MLCPSLSLLECFGLFWHTVKVSLENWPSFFSSPDKRWFPRASRRSPQLSAGELFASVCVYTNLLFLIVFCRLSCFTSFSFAWPDIDPHEGQAVPVFISTTFCVRKRSVRNILCWWSNKTLLVRNRKRVRMWTRSFWLWNVRADGKSYTSQIYTFTCTLWNSWKKLLKTTTSCRICAQTIS